MKTQSVVSGFLLALSLPALALAAQTTVSLSANSINPSIVTINPGDTVVWNNIGSSNQTVMANNGAFQSGAIGSGGQFAATFSTSGTYNYYDNASGSAVVGEVIVSGSSQVQQPTYVTTAPTSNSSTASLTAEVQALIAQINALEGQSGGSPVASAPTYTTGGSCPQIGRVLSYGTSGSDVTGVQQFLGVSPATGFYGSLTQSAVERWQTANNIISYGTPGTTGYGVVGPRTEAAIRLACSGGSGGTTGGSGTTGTVSGFIQVTPISGAAPLGVSVVATVNTANVCTGGTYTLSYGDGSASQVINVSQGNCSQQNQTFQHTYQYGGSYTVTLSAGSHQSTATVTVSGPAAPSSGSSTQASGSISALVTSGPPPLNVTFYVSCSSGLAYDVVFGDGSDLGSTGVSQSTCNGGLQGIPHTYSKSGTYTGQLEVFVRNSNGAVSPMDVANQTITVGSGSSSTPSSSTYQSPTVTPNVGGNPLAISLQYNYDSSGCEVSVNWGDGASINPTGCSTFNGTSQTFTQSHTYAQAGAYTVTLQRASQTDTVGVSISN